MKKAVLIYEDYNESKAVTLESSSLNSIDAYTSHYTDVDELKASFKYELRSKNTALDINNSDIKLYCVKDATTKEQLPLLLNDEKPLELYDDNYKDKKSQVEISRKLIFGSKNRMYLKRLLNNERLSSTLLFTVNISYSEYRYAIKKGLNVINEDGKYYILAQDVFKYVSSNDKLGLLRNLFEDTLEIWKRRIINLPVDDLYYYSRDLRILENEYYNSINNLVGIRKLNLRDNNLFTYLSDTITMPQRKKSEKVKKII